MADHTDALQDQTAPNPSVADVLRKYHELDLPASLFVEPQPLDAKTLEVLRQVEGYADPASLAGQLSSALRVLWVARKSGELADEDGDATLWLLAEVASLLENAIDVSQTAAWLRAMHEKAAACDEQNAKPATKRHQKAKGVPE